MSAPYPDWQRATPDAEFAARFERERRARAEREGQMDAWRMACVGTLINSALYLVMIFVLGVAWGYRDVAVFAVLTAGLAYLGYWAQVTRVPVLTVMLIVNGSIVFGVLTGLVLVYHVARG